MITRHWVLAGLACLLALAPALASDNSKSKVNPKVLLQPPPPWNTGPGYDPATGLPLQEPGVVDVSVQTIALPIMAIPALAPAVASGLSSIVAAFGGQAGAGATIIGQAPQDLAPLVAMLNWSSNASNFVLDFSADVPLATQYAQRLFLMQQALIRLNIMYTSGDLPQGITPGQVKQLYDQIFDAFKSLLDYPPPGISQVPSDPGTEVSVNSNSSDTISSTLVASASVNNVGAADSGSDGGGD